MSSVRVQVRVRVVRRGRMRANSQQTNLDPFQMTNVAVIVVAAVSLNIRNKRKFVSI